MISISGMRQLLIVGVVLLCTGLTSAQEFGEVLDSEWAVVAPESYPEADVVILFDRCSYRLVWGSLDIERHVRIKVLTDAGREYAGEASLWHHNEYEHIHAFKGQTLTPDGKVHTVMKDAIHTVKDGSFSREILTFPLVEEGVIVEYRYHMSTDRYTFLRPWYFQNQVYTMSSSISVTTSPNFSYTVAYQAVPVEQQGAVGTESHSLGGTGADVEKSKTLTWTVTDRPPLRGEAYMSAVNDYRSSLRFHLRSYRDEWNYIEYMEDWPKAGERFQRFTIGPYLNKGRAIKKLAKSVTADLIDDLEKAKAIYDHVTTDYTTSFDYTSKYFSHEKIEGLLNEKTGTPAGKNLLFIRMAEAVGVDAWPVFVSRRDHGKLYIDNPDRQQFDYMLAVVHIDDMWYYLDCSSHLVKFGLIPPSCLTDYGLLVDDGESALVQVPKLETPSYRIDYTRMFVDSVGVVACSSQCIYTDFCATEAAQKYERTTESGFVNSEFVSRMVHDFRLEEYTFDRDSLDRVRVDFSFTTEDLVRTLSGDLLVTPVCYDFRYNPFRSEKRFFPVDFNYPFVYHNIVEIFAADSVAAYDFPEDFSVGIEGATFVRQTEIRDSSIVVASQLSIENPVYQPFQYYQLRQLFEQIAANTATEIRMTLAP